MTCQQVFVTGSTAETIDFDDVPVDHLPVVFAFVLGLSFILLMVAFRSILVPFTSILMNLLSVAAAYGAVVAVFQYGFLADLFGFTQVDTITSWLPVMLFCILFGLSMDYHVFLLSRVREHFDHTGDNDEAVRVGLQQTGRLITGAALIMVAVFASFAGGRLVEMQQMGFGLAFAVLLDATLIRTILVPAVLKLCGNANWYLPRWLRWLPDFRVEGDLAPVRLPKKPANWEPARPGPLPSGATGEEPRPTPHSIRPLPRLATTTSPGGVRVCRMAGSGFRQPQAATMGSSRTIAFWSEGIPMNDGLELAAAGPTGDPRSLAAHATPANDDFLTFCVQNGSQPDRE